MHSPTPAEKKTILAALPKPPEGKVWRQYKADEKIGEGHFISFRCATVNRSSPNAGVIGYFGRDLSSENSSWKLVPAPKRSPKTSHRYAYSPMGGFIEKFSPNTYQIFYPTEVCPEQKRVDLYGLILSSIENGKFEELTRAEFLAKIKEWGINEDGTKIVAPPKVRYFINTDGFGGGTAYVRHDGGGDDLSVSVCVQTDGSEERCGPSLGQCVAYTKYPWSWKEVTESEAKALLTPPKTELELVKEQLASAKEENLRLRSVIAASQKELGKA